MLSAIKSPIGCFGLEYVKTDATCKTCPHVLKCQEIMGDRVHRVTVAHADFALIPNGFVRRTEELNENYRDVDAIYVACYRQIFGENPVGYVGSHREKVFQLADVCQVSVPMFILISMFGHYHAYPEKVFSPTMLIDNRAVNRVQVYAEACREKFGAVTVAALDRGTGGDIIDYDLEKRMRESEIMAGDWIIKYRLYHSGLPYEMLFTELENELDPAWLATDPHYEAFITDYSTRKRNPTDKESQATRHAALEVFKRMKRGQLRMYEAITNFRSRERIMPDAVRIVLRKQGYSPGDFEIDNKPITDTLHFWNRLAVAIQHMECLLFVNYHEGIYAV